MTFIFFINFSKNSLSKKVSEKLKADITICINHFLDFDLNKNKTMP